MNTFQAQFSKQADEFMSAAREVRVPESVQALAEDSIERTRDAYSKLTSVTKEAAMAMTEVADLAQVNVKTLGDRMLANTLSQHRRRIRCRPRHRPFAVAAGSNEDPERILPVADGEARRADP